MYTGSGDPVNCAELCYMDRHMYIDTFVYFPYISGQVINQLVEPAMVLEQVSQNVTKYLHCKAQIMENKVAEKRLW